MDYLTEMINSTLFKEVIFPIFIVLVAVLVSSLFWEGPLGRQKRLNKLNKQS